MRELPTAVTVTVELDEAWWRAWLNVYNEANGDAALSFEELEDLLDSRPLLAYELELAIEADATNLLASAYRTDKIAELFRAGAFSDVSLSVHER